MSGEDSSGLDLFMLQGESESVKTFWINPMFVGCQAFSIGVNQSYVEHLVKQIAESLRITVSTYPNYVDALPAPPEGFGYLLEIKNLDGKVVVEATYQQVKLGDLSEADRKLVRGYLDKLLREWGISKNIIFA